LITIKCSERNGPLLGIKEVADDQELMVITKNGIIIRMAVADISTLGRNTQGVRIISLKNDDHVIGLARVEAEADEGTEES
jgi:DNA gyrase subunit A